MIVAAVADGDSAVLEYLAAVGITPGTRLAVTEVGPFGMVTVAPTSEGEESVSLPEEVAATVRVRDLEPDQPENGSMLAG